MHYMSFFTPVVSNITLRIFNYPNSQSFNWASDTEMKHQEFYTKALEALNANLEKNLPFDYLVCPVCGNTYDKANADDQCAFCLTGKDKFIAI